MITDLIPDNSKNWIIKKNVLMYYKYTNIPICFIQDDIVYIFLEHKLHNQVIKLTKHLISKDINFFFTTPEYSIPDTIIDNNKVIYHYLYSYINKYFFNGFKKIDFGLIENLCEWTKKENCYNLIKENYDLIVIKVNEKDYNFYSNTHEYNYDIEIREDFSTLYREIQINQIMNNL
jgi:hypothetical protein